MTSRPAIKWFNTNWQYAGSTAGIFLFATLPLLRGFLPQAFLLTFLQLPMYMLHQVEEHHQDRFRRFVNDQLANGQNALTPGGVVVINVLGVWIVDLCALYLVRFVRPGLGLIAIYLALVNVLAHALGALVLRAYNPGLITAIFLLFPAAAAGWWFLDGQGLCSGADHAIGLIVALAVHAAVMLYVQARAKALRDSPV